MKAFNYRYLWDEVKDRLGLVCESPELPKDNLQDIMVVEEAKREWKVAIRYFDEVTEPALVDFAIHNMEAAEKRLVHLIRMLGNKYPQGIWPADFLALDGENSNRSDEAPLMEG